MAYRDAVLAHPDLLAFYEFDETSGTVAGDSEGSADLTIAGGVTLGADPIAEGGTKSFTFSRAGLGRAPSLPRTDSSRRSAPLPWR